MKIRVTVQEAAEMLHMSTTAVRARINDGRLDGVRVGNTARWMVSMKSILSLDERAAA